MQGTYPVLFRLAILVFASGFALFAQKTSPNSPWEPQNSTTSASLRGIHAVGGGVAWASGTNGTVLRTEDGGYMWQSCAMPPGAEKLDFRGIWAWDANTAMAMSSGPGDLSRLYKTTDGCSSWKLVITNPERAGFWDAVAFFSKEEGLILGDPVEGIFRVIEVTIPERWPAGSLHPSLDDYYHAKDIHLSHSGAFAASNSSLVLRDSDSPGRSGERWSFGTGGEDGPSVLSYAVHNKDGASLGAWTRVPVPLASGTDSSGVFSLAFRDQNHGIAAGGDYKKPNEPKGTAAWTADGGKSWIAAAKPPNGYRSAVAWDEQDKAWIAAGSNGSDVSYDDGKTWQPLDDGNWNALSLPWVVGPNGRIAKLVSLGSAEKSKADPAK